VGAGAAVDSHVVLSGKKAIGQEQARRANAVIFSSALRLRVYKNKSSHPKNGS